MRYGKDCRNARAGTVDAVNPKFVDAPTNSNGTVKVVKAKVRFPMFPKVSRLPRT